MHQARKSAPELAITLNEALENTEKVIDLVDRGLLDSTLGCSKYLDALNNKSYLLLELEREEESNSVAEKAVKFADSMGFIDDEGEPQRQAVVSAWYNLTKCKVAIGNSEDIVNTAKHFRFLLNSEDGKIRPGQRSHWSGSRRSRRLWILKFEPMHLAKLGRFKQAVALIQKRLEIKYVSGRLTGQPRYFSSAELMAQALFHFRESEFFSLEEYEAAKSLTFDWLQLAHENNQFRSIGTLDAEVWALLREDKRFFAIEDATKVKRP